ncbi:hypothetical protein D8Y22_09955 [Salinadaptatus halalkaliphilus]|uniref:Uncharacterized protein n=1 Tax=Salinadaptatus halalkaliphilus TaxID=2419781 RepID=A0A4S3TLI5_9EURY|nr:DUF5791 family protein [Salinadaptatus halalkaliphilus]THE65029.1 hypothetical protein D8Y22_09955 [Salinadaptatus halalkaliphilus]
MFHEQRLSAPDSPEQLQAEYAADLAAIVDGRGPDAVADATDLDPETAAAVGKERVGGLSLEAAAQIQALEDGAPDAETIVTMACEHLLLGMTTAVMDVDAVESELEIELDAKEIQQKIERRAPMSFEEFVHVQYAIADGAP